MERRRRLAKELVRDGEGAQRLIEVDVNGAASESDARVAAREIAGSLLVKAAVHGRDPNWGRIMMALGKSGADMDESRIQLFINGIQIVHEGKAIPYSLDAVVGSMGGSEVSFRVELHNGTGSARAWG